MGSSYSRIVIRNAHMLDRDGTFTIELLEGRVHAIQPTAAHSNSSDDTIEIDASDQIAVPGLCDLYTRLREPGLTRKGNILSECKSALFSGFTTVFCSPDTLPTIDNVATVQFILQRAQEAKFARVIPIAALTCDLKGEHLSELATLQNAGCIAAGQADVPIESSSVLYSAMEYASSFDLPLIMTARDSQLGIHGCAHAGAVATQLGLPEIPIAAETVPLARLLEIAKETNCRVHISRVSSERALQMIDIAKQSDLPISCDVGLHHLFFTDTLLSGYDSHFHSAVPFRSASDRDALRRGVKSGLIDAICTDHAPHDVDASLAPFPSTEPGLACYPWALPLILKLPEVLELNLSAVLKKFYEAPRKILMTDSVFGLKEGEEADFFLLASQQKPEKSDSSTTQSGKNHPLVTHHAKDLELGELKGLASNVFTQNLWYERA